MNVIMAYHSLVDRDSKYVARYWKYIIIGLLAVVSITGFIGSFSFNYLIENYNQNCILNSQIEFHPKPFTQLDESNESVIKRIAIERKKDIERDASNNTVKFNMFDTLYMDLMEIDENHSSWGKSCDYVRIAPMLVGFFAIVWIALFTTCGHGGNTSGIMPKPWRIVIPAIVFFAIMTIFSFINVIYLMTTIDGFCKQLSDAMTADYDCSELVEGFSLVKDGINGTSTAGSKYILTLGMTWTSTILWLITLIVMIFRCVFVIDFQLVKVTVTKNETTKQTEAIISNGDHQKHIKFKDEVDKDYSDDDDDDDETSFTTTQNSPDKSIV